MSYLKNKYGAGNFKVINSQAIHDSEKIDFYVVKLKSEFTKGSFYVTANKNIKEDTFLSVYYSEKYNLDYDAKYPLKNFYKLAQYLKSEIKKKSDVDVDKVNFLDYFYDNYDISELKEERIPELEELIDDYIKRESNKNIQNK